MFIYQALDAKMKVRNEETNPMYTLYRPYIGCALKDKCEKVKPPLKKKKLFLFCPMSCMPRYL